LNISDKKRILFLAAANAATLLVQEAITAAEDRTALAATYHLHDQLNTSAYDQLQVAVSSCLVL
jgi:hypothetical protein